jgi:hypothetical protein
MRVLGNENTGVAMNTEKYIYLRSTAGRLDSGTIIKRGDVCRFDRLQHWPKDCWEEIKTPVELLTALKTHRLLVCGMPINEYYAYMAKEFPNIKEWQEGNE